MKTKLKISLVISLILAIQLSAQIDPQQTLPDHLRDKIELPKPKSDTIPDANAFQTPDSLRIKRQAISISPDSLDAKIEYSARDSMQIDALKKKIYLWGEAQVNYTSVELKADFIELDWNTNEATARGVQDTTTGSWSGLPHFKEGDQEFDAKELRFNFKTQKGIILEASTIQQNLYVHGTRTKFVSAGGDTTKNDVIYNQGAIFTTCNLPHPHYGVHSTKQKVIPGELVIIGPSNIEIADVPTPLWLPFGFFPIQTGASSGLIFPKGYEYSDNWGFGLANIGWYFPLGEYMNLQVTGDVYLKGTYRVRAISNYTKRYKYRGNFRLEYGSLNNEDSDAIRRRDQTFLVNFSHNQDSKAHPSRTLGGSINFQTNNALRNNYTDANSVLQSSISSSFNYRERFPGRPYNLSIGLTHSQNTQTQRVTINFPTATFKTDQMKPFERKKRVGPEQWYEKITLRYSGEAKNQLIATDTTLFTQQTLKDAQYGAKHTATMATSFKLFNYFNVNPNANYRESWYFNTTQKNFDPTIETQIIEKDGVEILDTLNLGTVIDTTNFGFARYNKFDAGFNIDTKLFGTMFFKKGRVRGVRHTVSPSIGFRYSPSQEGFFDEVRNNALDIESTERYSIFEDGIYDRPSFTGEQMNLTYRLGNIVEAKMLSKKDSTERNVRLLRKFDINGSYNFAADTVQFSTIKASTAATLFNGMTNVTLTATYDPYAVNENDQRINTFYRNETGKLLRFDRATARFNTTLTVKKIREMITGDRDKDEDPNAPPRPNNGDNVLNEPFDQLGGLSSVAPIDDLDMDEKQNGFREEPNIPVKDQFIDLFENFNINHTLVFNVRPDTTIVTNNISLRGNVQLTENWAFTVGNFGYEFSKMQFTFPSVGIRRDLHCWELGGSWQPTLGTFSFYVRVKPGSTLDFLNVPYRRGVQDGF